MTLKLKKKRKKSTINILTFYLKTLKKEEQSKPKARRRKIIMIRMKINKYIEQKNNRKNQ